MKLKSSNLFIILFVLGLVYYFSFSFIYKSTIDDLINQQVQSSKNQANIISNLLAEKIKSGFSKEQVKNELQRSIENSSTDYSFVCMFDATGKEICHPNKEKIGKTLLKNNSVISSVSNNKVIKNFKDAVMEQQSIGGIRKLENYTEIVYLSHVKGTDWVVASHTNMMKLKETFKNSKQNLGMLFLLVWISSSFLIYFFLQKMNHQNLAHIKELNRQAGNQYFNELSSINKALDKTIKYDEYNRLLANKGYQLTPVFINNIALIFTENKISYIIEKNGEKSSINLPLDELFKTLNNNLFYRTSRKAIVSINAIDKIEKYGNTQLKVITKPKSPIDIVVSKGKLSDFKKWVGKN